MKDTIRGCLIGGAIGDALGEPWEGSCLAASELKSGLGG